MAIGIPIVQPTPGFVTRLKNRDGDVKLICSAVTIGDFLDRLSGQFQGRPIRNATGLEGKYNFVLVFHSLTSIPTDAVEPDANSAPGIFAALRQQLGLRLVPGKAPMTVFVVDHLAKTPTEN